MFTIIWITVLVIVGAGLGFATYRAIKARSGNWAFTFIGTAVIGGLVLIPTSITLMGYARNTGFPLDFIGYGVAYLVSAVAPLMYQTRPRSRIGLDRSDRLGRYDLPLN